MQLASHSPLEPTLQPALHRAIALSHRRNRQIWVIWTGNKIALCNAYRRGRGLLLARVAGDEIIRNEVYGYEGS